MFGCCPWFHACCLAAYFPVHSVGGGVQLLRSPSPPAISSKRFRRLVTGSRLRPLSRLLPVRLALLCWRELPATCCTPACAAEPSPVCGKRCSRRLQNPVHADLAGCWIEAVCRSDFLPILAALKNAFSKAVSRGILPFVTALLATGLMLRLNWHIGMIAVILWPWAILAPRAMRPRSVRASLDSRKHQANILQAVEENLSAQGLIRAFAVEHLSTVAFRTRNEALARSAMKAGLSNAFVERFTGTGILLEQAFVLALNLWLVFAGEMTVGTMVALQMLAALVGSSLLCLVEYVPVLASAREAFEEIRKTLRETGAVSDAPDAGYFRHSSTEIVFSDVSFSNESEGVSDDPPCDETRAVPHSSLSRSEPPYSERQFPAAFVGSQRGGARARC